MYPRKVNLFIPWSKAMVAGATLDRPDYGKGSVTTKKATKNRRRRKRRRKRRQKDGET